MVEVRAIPTPWSQRWRRVQYRLLPVLVFGVCSAMAVWLWRQHAGLANAIGEAEVKRIDLTAPADGLLVPLDRQWQTFEPVQEGQVLARLDDSPALAMLATLRKGVEQLQKELAATEARVRQDIASFDRDQLGMQHDTVIQLRRLALDIEELRLEVLDREADIETDKLELQRQVERYDATEKLAQRGMETQSRLWDIRLRRDVVQKRKEGNEKALAEARSQLKNAQEREAELRKLMELPTTQPAPLETLLAPVRAAIAVQETRVREVQLQIQSLDVRAPFDGMIREIFRYPGQTVRMGEPLLTLLASDSPYVVTYVREHHRIGPQVGMEVEMRLRTLPVRTVQGHVSQIGPQVVRVPLQHLRDPKFPEWGLPVRIDFPSGSGIHPGEMVDITFHRAANNAP